MANKYCKYEKEREYVSHDNGLTWEPLDEYRTGELIEELSPSCGANTLYRWVGVDYFMCEGKDKWSMEVKQVSYDGGVTYTPVFPYEQRKVELIENDSPLCNNASEGHYDDSTNGPVFGIDPIKIVKCDNITDGELTQVETTMSGRRLSSFTIGDCVTKLGVRCFRDQNLITNFELTDNITSLGNYSFQNCASLSSMTFPTSITEYGNYLLSGCTSLSFITVLGFNRVLDSYTSSLKNPSNCPIYVPYKNVSRAKTTFSQSANYIQAYKMYSKYSDNMERVIGIEGADSATTITSADTRSFSTPYTAMTKVVISDYVTSIGDYAFYDCTSLDSITVLANTPPSIGWYSFDDTNDCLIYVPPSKLNNYLTAWSNYADRIVPYDNNWYV